MNEAVYANVAGDVISYMKDKISSLERAGVHDVVIDPGFGFAKTREHNFELLGKLELMHILGKPVLAGVSRKSMVWKTLSIKPEDALNGTTVLNTIALLKGVSILRVHDVLEAQQAVRLITAMSNQ